MAGEKRALAWKFLATLSGTGWRDALTLRESRTLFADAIPDRSSPHTTGGRERGACRRGPPRGSHSGWGSRGACRDQHGEDCLPPISRKPRLLANPPTTALEAQPRWILPGVSDSRQVAGGRSVWGGASGVDCRVGFPWTLSSGPQQSPPWRQPRVKLIVCIVNSHTSATRIGWHMWEITLSSASGLPPGWVPLPTALI